VSRGNRKLDWIIPSTKTFWRKLNAKMPRTRRVAKKIQQAPVSFAKLSGLCAFALRRSADAWQMYRVVFADGITDLQDENLVKKWFCCAA